MQIRPVLTMLMLGLLAFSFVGSPTSAQELPEPPEEPVAETCVIPATLGASLFFSCSTGTHQYSELIEHGVTGSVFTGEPGFPHTVSSQIQVSDPDTFTGWRTVHRITCTSMPDTMTETADPEACEEDGELPDPGTVVRHRCSTTRAVAGVIVCSIAYMR